MFCFSHARFQLLKANLDFSNWKWLLKFDLFFYWVSVIWIIKKYHRWFEKLYYDKYTHLCVWFVLLNLLGQNFCPLHVNIQDLWLSCQDHLYSSVGFTAYLAAVCVDSQHHKTLMGNRISEEKHSGNVLALRQRFMVVYVVDF